MVHEWIFEKINILQAVVFKTVSTSNNMHQQEKSVYLVTFYIYILFPRLGWLYSIIKKKVHFLYTMTLWHKLWNRSYTTFSEIYGLHEKPAFTSVSRTHRTYFQSEYSVRFHSAWSFHKFTTLGTKSQKAECKDNGKSTQNNRQT